jgi:class 3 adenylate cyclase
VVEQPAGTVTLVFTDIEGSTRLLNELGQDVYRDALARTLISGGLLYPRSFKLER